MTDIVMDCREQAPVLQQMLENSGFRITVRQLKIGDFLIEPDITIERKTVRDFCLSILDGRLFNQAYRLVAGSEHPLLIIEGGNFADSDVKLRQTAIKGALITLAQTFRLPVLRSRDACDTAWHFRQLALQRLRIGVNKGPLTAYRPKTLNARKQRLLKTLPGVGSHLAEVLLREFGSISNLCQASEKELLTIHGIGQKKVGEILRALRETPARYGPTP